ncbi:MAG: hypothetical protein M0019_11345 [Actinomycetota bacterium]|nr:hypothetical protein [Actinomycetota bacterium]
MQSIHRSTKVRSIQLMTLAIQNGVIGIVANGAKGYWIAESKVCVYGLGTAPVFSNSLAGSVNDIVSFPATPDRGGYYLIGSDGAVFAGEDATSHGSIPLNRHQA